VLLIILQITLGAQVIWTARSVYVTTGHVVVGALTLAVTFLVTFLLHRDAVETPAPSAA
jgi:cytochrome c oxidase assembly protein subunit 15